jgi:hypothetical protein
LIASEGAISAYLIAKVGAADYGALQFAAIADKFIGVSTEIDTASGEHNMDVVHEGVADIKLGGTVLHGDFLTTDANGQGVTVAPTASVNK